MRCLQYTGFNDPSGLKRVIRPWSRSGPLQRNEKLICEHCNSTGLEKCLCVHIVDIALWCDGTIDLSHL